MAKIHIVSKGSSPDRSDRVRVMCGRKVDSDQTRKRLPKNTDGLCYQCLDKFAS